MEKIVFVGCSFTSGVGWNETLLDKSECKDSPHLWVNLCHKNINRLSNFELVNLGKSGVSNTEIFENSVSAIATHKQNINTLIVQWTSGPRYNFNAGFELWDTVLSFNKRNIYDVNLNNGDHWPKNYISDLVDRLLVLHHVHWEIVKIVRYAHILVQLAEMNNIRIIFINGICPWDNEYFVKLPTTSEPEDYTEFTKTHILNIKNRNNQDILKLYNLAHTHYTDVGGISPQHWVNLYQSQKNSQIDVNHDGRHPGIISNQIYFQQVKTFLETQ